MLGRISHQLKLFLSFVALYFVLQIVFQGAFHLASSHSPSSPGISRLYQSHYRGTEECQNIHILIFCPSLHQCDDITELLTTLFLHRSVPIQLHIVADSTCQLVLSTLIQTWDLHGVSTEFHPVPSSLASKPEDRNLISNIVASLHLSTSQVIFLSSRVRILADLQLLWGLFQNFTPKQVIGIVQYPGVQLDQYDVMLFRTNRTSPVNSSELGGGQVYQMPCSWSIPASSTSQTVCQLSPQALIMDIKKPSSSSNHALETAMYKLGAMMESDGELAHVDVCGLQQPPSQPTYTDKCAVFRHAAQLKRRTHLYFIGEPYRPSTMDPNDVTLMTQLTVDRFEVFEKFLNSWDGPAVAVFHVRPSDALQLRQLVQKSPSLNSRSNVAYHLVYRRGPYYPINYLRNVAVKTSTTPYTLFIDVDLVATPGMYRRAKAAIDKYLPGTTKTALVVATFEAFEELPKFPEDKKELLQMMEDDKVDGYKMKRAWNLGHKPTNYPKWKTATEPYEAIWKNAYEPYAILDTKSLPEYNNSLLERMGDKIAYGREIYAQGYKFLVLHDVFVIHLPHPVSEGTNLWKHEKNYMGCGGILFQEYAKYLQETHPDKTF